MNFFVDDLASYRNSSNSCLVLLTSAVDPPDSKYRKFTNTFGCPEDVLETGVEVKTELLKLKYNHKLLQQLRDSVLIGTSVVT